MKLSEAETLIEAVRRELDGIDETEVGSLTGWWETSTGARFGAERLASVIALIEGMVDAPGRR